MIPPLWFQWDGDNLMPLHPKLCDKHLVIGERYCMVEHKDRSEASHRQYFAAINEAWSNLPEMDAERFATPEALRKYALIRAGWRDERTIVCASKAEAERVAAFVRPMDEHAVVTFREAVVRVWTAQSQSYRAMGKTDFQKSKDDVLRVVGEMVGVTPADLSNNAGRAA